MAIALVSDIHGNLPALRAVLADIDARREITAVYHVGDLVGYAPWPNEVVDLIRQRGIAGVSGNYDSTVALRYKHCGCRSENPHQEELAHQSFAWTLAHVTEASRGFLAALPFRMDLRPLGGHVAGPSVRLVHGSHALSTVYVTEDRSDDFLRTMAQAMGARAGDIVCFGHTHRPWQRTVDDVQFVNTGSVGRPKDGDPRAGYVVLDVSASNARIDIVRVSYDVEEAARGILASALPDEFADFLRSGGAPTAPPVRSHDTAAS